MIYKFWSSRASVHLYVRIFARSYTSACDKQLSLSGHGQEANWTARQLFTRNRIQQRKYKKRRGKVRALIIWVFLVMEIRYFKVFSTVEPTLFNVCEYWFLKDQNRLRDLPSRLFVPSTGSGKYTARREIYSRWRCFWYNCFGNTGTYGGSVILDPDF